MSKLLAASLALLALCAITASAANDVVDGFLARAHHMPGAGHMPYRLFLPDAKLRASPLPLVVYLHGSGGAGTDNLKQISGGNTQGTHFWISPALQSSHPAFVVVPQLPGANQWGEPDSDELPHYAAQVVSLIDKLSREFSIDADRIYLVGQSRGGRGAWDLVSKRPDLFAAAVPLCGYGNASRVVAARDVPIWAFHGAQDRTVPVTGSRELVAALKAAGSGVKYTEYPEGGHDVWTLAFAEKELPEWLFSQRRNRRGPS